MTSNVEGNYMARQVLLVQQKIPYNFPYKPKMYATYWIKNAVDLCRDFNVRHERDVVQLLSAKLRDCS